MNQDQVESQLSAMFDGELPVAECELLSRRIDRDESLRARWSRYALIGAAMRSEPVAAAGTGFATRVSAALAAESRPRARRQQRLLWNSALAAGLVAAVAGLSITMLREDASRFDAMGVGASAGTVASTLGTAVPATTPRSALQSPAPQSSVLQSPAPHSSVLQSSASQSSLPQSSAQDGALGAVPASTVAAGALAHEPWSYVTPAGVGSGNSELRTQLAAFMVAHSVYSAPLLRPNLMSVLVSSEDGLGNASDFSRAAGAAVLHTAGHIDAAAAAGAHGQ